MCEFTIKELELKNYRRFEDKKIHLDSKMNVFVGKNGSGKTALLEAACVMLGAYLAAYKTYVPSRFVFNIAERDAHKKTQNALDKSVLTPGGIPQYPCIVKSAVQWGNSVKPIFFQRVLAREGARTKFDGSNPMQPLVVEWEDMISKANHNDDNVILPLVLYLSSARLWNENSTTKGEKVFTRTMGYNRCLDAKHGIELAFDYLQNLQLIAFEENGGVPYPAYTAILDAVNQALKGELQEGEQVIFSSRYKNDMVALKTKDDTIVPFTSLSDGYRNVIKIVLDIATRMCILNPYVKEKALELTPGVVVIDEIDLSLHPTWQQRIIKTLKTLFPKIQFICATHSPFIIQSLKEGELQTLDKDLQDEYSGEGIEDISEEIMGVDMPQYSEERREMYEVATEYFKLLDKAENLEQIKKLKERLLELEAEYSDNPAYAAWMRQQTTKREWEIMKNETSE